MLLSATALFRPRCFRAISELESQMIAQQDISVGPHRLGGIGFCFRGREVSHVHGNGLLDCLVGRANRDLLLRERRAHAHHIFPGSGWISFWLEESDDVGAAIALIRIACAHRETADEH